MPILAVNSAEVDKKKSSEARAEQAEKLKAKAEELAASLDQEVWVCITMFAVEESGPLCGHAELPWGVITHPRTI